MNSFPAPWPILVALLVLPLAEAAAPSIPVVEEWPPVESAPVVAKGFLQTGWTEAQWRNDSWESTQRRELTYDTQARLISVRNESWFMDKWQVANVEAMTYDDSGRLIQKIRQEAIGITLQNRARSTYDYRESGTIRETLDAWSHQQKWLPLSQEIYQFDAASRLIQHTSNRYQGNLTRGVAQVLMRYDTDGRRTEALKQRNQGGKWVTAERVTFTYDTRGQLAQTTMLVLGKGGPQWIEGLKVTHENDAGRRSASVWHTRGPTDGLEPKTRVQYAYDAPGSLIEKRHQTRRDGKWIDVRKETFSHRPKS